MNIKDTYLHGGSNIVKNITFTVPNSGNDKDKLMAVIEWATEGEAPTYREIPISSASYGVQSPNYVFAGPSSGESNAAPIFRRLVEADIPALAASLITTGTFTPSRLPIATSSDIGAVQLNSDKSESKTTLDSKEYWVLMTYENKLYVAVPWTWLAFLGATADSAGTDGYLTAPGIANKDKFLKGDGTWANLTSNVSTELFVGASNGELTAEQTSNGDVYLILKEGSTYTRYNIEGSGLTSVTSNSSGKITINTVNPAVFTGATGASANGTAGLVPAPTGTTYNKNYFLKADATWEAITSNVTTKLYVGGSSGTSTTEQSTNGSVYLILKEGNSYTRYNIAGSGRTTVTSDSSGKITVDTAAYNDFTAATSASTAGTAGLVPAPGTTTYDKTTYFLRSDATWLALGSNAFDSTAYLPLAGNTTSSPMTGTIYSKNVDALYICSQNKDVDIWHIDGNSTAWDNSFGFNLRYLGTGTENNNDLVLYAHNRSGNHVEVYRVHLDGTFIFNNAPKVGNNVIYHAGNIPSNTKTVAGIVAAPNAAGKVYMTDTNGDPGWATIDTTVTSSSSNVVTSGAVYTAIANNVASAVQYLGTVDNANAVTSKNTAGYGDFVRVTTAFTISNLNAHVGDIIYLNSTADNAYATAANWVVAHTEIDTNTWTAASTSAAGYVPLLAAGGDTIVSSDVAYVLTYKSGVNGTTSPVWMQLPTSAYASTLPEADFTHHGYVPSTVKNKFLHADSDGDLEWIDDNNTWKPATSGQEGYIPLLSNNDTNALSSSTNDYVLAFTYSSSGTLTPAWKKLPSTAYSNTWILYVGATAQNNATAGYVPAATSEQREYFFRGDGTWLPLTLYSLPTASGTTLGGVKVDETILSSTSGYTKVHIDSNGFIYYHDTTYSFSNLSFLQTSGTDLMTYNSQAVRTVLAGTNITFTHSDNVLTIASNDELVKFASRDDSVDYYLPFKSGTGNSALLLYYNSNITINPGTSTITATLNGNASTATKLNINTVGYLYQAESSGNITTSTTGASTVNSTELIGIPYILYDGTANTYGLHTDLFSLSSGTKYIGNGIHSKKFATMVETDGTHDDWSNSTVSGSSQSETVTTYSAGDGISINNGVISTTRKEWFGTEALFNTLASLDLNTTYYITED